MNKNNRSVILIIIAVVIGLGISVWIFKGEAIKHWFIRNENMKFVKSLGAGINIGNDLDVYIDDLSKDLTVDEYERYWGNEPVTNEVFAAIKKAGFKTVRIPVTFSYHMDQDGNIDEAFMSRVKEVVDMALSNGLFVIIDAHHENFIVPTYEQEEEVTRKLVSIWKQVARTFDEYDNRLIFEGMNEPRLQDTDEEWTDGTKELRTVVNNLNKAFVDTVRASGGKNTDRLLIITDYGGNYRTHALENLDIIDDEHLAVAVHAYLPYKFTEASKGKEKWKEDQESYTEDIIELQRAINDLFISKNIPVIITEFGCEEKQSEDQRVAWANYYVKTFSSIGVPCIWWDNGDEYKLIDRETAAVTNEQLVQTLVSYYK